MESIIESYSYGPELDQARLEETYEGDLEYMHCMFETFVETIEAEIELLGQALIKSDWKEIRKIVHKIKPNFSMVGLTDHYHQAIRLEQLCDETGAFTSDLEEKVYSFTDQVKASKGIIQRETQKLEHVLENQ